MKILLLISSEGFYGAESMLVSLSRDLMGMGVHCRIGAFHDTRNPHTEVARVASSFGIPVEVVPCRGRFDVRTVGTIRALLTAHNITVVHTHGYKADLYGFAASAGRRVGLVSTCHNWPDKRLSMRAYAAVDRLILRAFDQIGSPSKPVIELLHKSGVSETRLTYIPNGVDEVRFSPARTESHHRSGCTVGFVGRLVAEKGGAVLLEAAAAIVRERPLTRFVFVGDGPIRAEWEGRAAELGLSETVSFLGVRSDMPYVYSTFDLLALPSFDEAMPMTLLEAMACGLPVVATAVGSVAELVAHEKTGLLVPPCDAHSLSEAIARLIDSAELRAVMGSAARAEVARRFSSRVTASRYVALYESAVKAETRPAVTQPARAEERQRESKARVDVSLVCACRNEARCMRGVLDSMLAQEIPNFGWELVIADGMSIDGTREILAEYAIKSEKIRVIDNPGQIVSTGLNAAIRAARGRYILRVDAHTTYAPNYCAQCIAVLERTGADNVGGAARTTAKGVKARAIAAAYQSTFSTGGACFHDPGYSGWVDTVPYGCWRRELFDRVGFFDEDLVRNQDDEFNLRLIRSGGRIWQDESIVSWYSPRAHFKGLFNQYFQYGFWKVSLIRKHRIPASWRHLVPAAFVLATLGLPLLAIVSWAVQGGVASLSAFAAIAVWAVYLLALGAASVAAARKHGWELLPLLPVAFAAYHFSYGAGFLAGVSTISRPDTATAGNSVYARITR